MRGLRFGLQLVSSVLFCAIGAGQAAAMPDYVVKRGQDDTCSLIFAPDRKTSEKAPGLVVSFRKSRKSNLISVGVEHARRWEAVELVRDNTRAPFPSFEDTRARAVPKTKFWTMLANRANDAAPLDVTVRASSGVYHSGRFLGLTAKGIGAALTKNCGLPRGILNASREDPKALAREQALDLKTRDVLHIRWFLLRTYTNATTADRAALSPAERDLIERYTTENGFKPSRYLTRPVANALLAEKFRPYRKDFSDYPRFKRFDDWVSFRDTKLGTCTIVTEAKQVNGVRFFSTPRMEIHTDPNERGNALYFDFVTPNRFHKDYPITAIVDGRKIKLKLDEGRVRPVDIGDGFVSARIVRAIRAGKTVQIRGTGLNGKSKHSFEFSALGFTAAFRKMARDCDRPEIREWLK